MNQPLKPDQINVYTAYRTENNKRLKGSAFAAVITFNDKQIDQAVFDPNATYMTVWLRGVANFLEEMASTASRTRPVNIQICMVHKNLKAICSKLESVFESMALLEKPHPRLLDLKLRRKNGSRYPDEAEHKRIVEAMLKIHKTTQLKIRFLQMGSRVPEMGIAYQYAILALEDGNDLKLAA